MLIGDLVVWFYEYLAGIAPASPGFKTILMKPIPVGDSDIREANAQLALRFDRERMASRREQIRLAD